jgi:uncharacterized protein (TIRG00374 family)
MAAKSEITSGGPAGWRPAYRAALVAVEILVTAGALVFLFRGIDLGETARAFKKANYWLLVPSVVFLILDLQLRSVRWRLLLSPQAGLRHNNLFGASNVGYMVNDVLPFRAGEVARVFVIDELEHTGKVRAAGSIAVERGIDVIAMVLLVIALFPFIEEPDWARGPGLILGAGVLSGFVMLLGMAWLRDSGKAFWKPWLRAVPRFGERLDDAGDTLLTALHPLRSIALLASVTMLTAVIWTCGTLSFLMVMMAFHLDVGFTAAALVIGATTLGMVVPSSPGYIGVFHAITVETLTNVFGVPKENALTYAVAQHALIYLVPGVLGAAFLWRRREMWRDFAASIGVGSRRLAIKELTAESMPAEAGHR